MAYQQVEPSTFEGKVIFRILKFACLVSLGLMLVVSSEMATAKTEPGNVTIKSINNLPSDSYKVRTNSLQVQVGGKTLSGEGVVIGIYDGGINLEDPAFISNGKSRIISQACVGESTEISGCETDPSKFAHIQCNETQVGCFHGMAVAGFAAANENVVNITGRKVDVSGIAPGAQISYVRQAMSSKGEIKYLDFVRALNKYVNDVRTNSPAAPDVINLSLSFPRTSYPNCDANNEVKRAIDFLTASGVVVVAASGNNSDKKSVAYPACISNVIAVGSSGFNSSTGTDQVSEFSNMSKEEIDIVAPGENQIGLMPEPGRFVTVSGTSFAAPIVTGAIALLKEYNPTITTAAVRNLFATNSDTVVDPATGESFAGLNVQKLLGADLAKIATETVTEPAGSGSIFEESSTSNAGIEVGSKILATQLLSSPYNISLIDNLYMIAAVAIMLAGAILIVSLYSRIFISGKSNKYALSPVAGRLSGYYSDHIIIDLTDDDDREPGADKVLV